MRRWVWLLAGLWIGCASGDEPATSAATTFAPTGSATATATATTTTASTTSGSTDDADADGESSAGTDDPTDPSGGTSTGPSTDTDTPGSSSGGSSSGEPPSEQPEDGMYSSCDSIVDCIGLTACLTATDTGGQPIDPFCTAGACKSPLAQCDPTPGGTAVPICLLTASEETVCALDCSQGQECPDGMDCRTLAGGSICS